MILSSAIIILLGFTLKGIFEKLKIPGLLGMLFTGILLGPFVLDIIDDKILNISADLRTMALIVILTRVGLSLDLKDLKKVGRQAFMMSFVPATFEITAVILLAPSLLGISIMEAAILGAVLGAVSPAVIVPKMLNLMESGYGKNKSIPQFILAGASVDDIYGIVLFTSFLGMYSGEKFNPSVLVKVPISVITGLLVGIFTGLFLIKIFKIFHMRDTVKVLLILGLSFLLMGLENIISSIFPFSGLLAVIAISGTILKKYEFLAKRISGKFSKIWVASELILFVLLGAAVDIRHMGTAGISIIILIFAALSFRSIGVLVSLLGTNLSKRERVFCIISYIPKATVQAAIGSIPLSVGVAAGNTILAASVIAILVTAPLGAVGIEFTYKRLLEKTKSH